MSEGSAENQIVQKTNKKTVWVLIIVVVLLLATIVSLIFAFVHAQKGDDSNVGSIRGIIKNEKDAADIISQMKNNKVKNGYFQTQMTNNWVFANGTAAGTNAYVGNADANTRPMYFDLILDETGETIYSSPVMPVGTHVEGMVLDKNLSAGNYTCTMIHHFLDDNYIETGDTVRFSINITVIQ